VKSLFTLGGKVNKNSMWVKEKKLGELICIRKCCPIVIFPWCSFKFSIEKSVYFSCHFVEIYSRENNHGQLNGKLNTQIKHKFFAIKGI